MGLEGLFKWGHSYLFKLKGGGVCASNSWGLLGTLATFLKDEERDVGSTAQVLFFFLFHFLFFPKRVGDGDLSHIVQNVFFVSLFF